MRFGKIAAAGAAALLSLAVSAEAQHGPGGLWADIDTDRNGKISKAEWETFHRNRIAEFGEIDRNNDGNIVEAELREFHRSRVGPPGDAFGKGGFRGPHGGGPFGGGPPGKFPLEKFDTDNDGKISRAEWDAHHGEMFERIDVNKDGMIESGELREQHERMGKKR